MATWSWRMRTAWSCGRQATSSNCSPRPTTSESPTRSGRRRRGSRSLSVTTLGQGGGVVLARYRAVLRTPGVGRLLATSLLARMPNGMSVLAILLLVTRENGYARAGLVTGAYVAASGLSNLLLSRAVDRVGPRPVLLTTAAAYATAMTGLALVPANAYVAELVLAIVAGAFSPPVVSVIRGLWPKILEPGVAQVVYGLEATAQELIFITGPALVALVAGTAGAPAAVILTAAFAFV